jgi:hypothetical protein
LVGTCTSKEVLEDNEATIKIIRKSGSAKLRHVSRTHRINLASIYEQFKDPNISLKYVNTKEQVADIFTKALPPQGWDHALRLMGVLYSAAPAGDREGSANGAPVAPAIAAPCPACSAVLAAPERWSDADLPNNAPDSAASAAPERWGDDDAFTKLPTLACEKGNSTSHLLHSVNRGVKSWDAPHLAEAHNAPATAHHGKYKFSNRRECMSTDPHRCAREHGRGELRNLKHFSVKTLIPTCLRRGLQDASHAPCKDMDP